MEVCRWEAHHPNATGSERFQRATGDEVNFSATAQRTSQKILASEAACHKDWSFVAVDIGKAFLHLLTFSEMTNIFDASLDMKTFANAKKLKPGTACRDAPRAFNLRLINILKELGFQPTVYDPHYFYYCSRMKP